MTVNETALTLIGAGGVVLGALVGGLSSLGTAAVTGLLRRKEDRVRRRRGAYSDLITALDQLIRTWAAPESLDLTTEKTMGALTSSAVIAVQQAYVAVLLTGSTRAEASAAEAHESAWAIYDRLYGPDSYKSKSEPAQKLLADISRLTKDVSDKARNFVKIAQHELQ